MLKDNWEERGIQGTHVGNLILQPLQGFPDNDHLAGSSTRRGVAVTSSGSTSEYSILQRFEHQSHHQNHLSESRPTFFGNPYENGIENIGSASHNMVSQLQPSLVRNTLVEEACKPIDNVCSQMEDHKSFHPPISCSTDSEKSLSGSNLQELIRFLSANYGPMKTPLEVGTPEYLRLVEILQQNSVQPNGFSDPLNITNGGIQEETTKEKDMQVPTSIHQSNVTSTEDESFRDNQGKITAHGRKNDLILGVPKIDEKKLPPEKATRVAAEKLWEGSLQLSSSVTLTAVAYFKSGEKLLGNNWPESIEVKGKVRLEAFEKYVQDLPRSRNRGLMVISVCWKEGSSDVGLTGMKEVAKGYQRSSRVAFAQLLSGIDLYICPRSDPIITILAKYGFFKGMSVIDDKPDSMIGCVVWRKNRPINPVGNTSDSSIQPQNSPSGLSVKHGTEKKPSPEKQALPESIQHDDPLTLPSTTNSESSKNVAASEVDLNGGDSSSHPYPLQNSVSFDNLVRKRAFEDDDLPEFDFGNASGKSTLVSQSRSLAITTNTGLVPVNCQKLDTPRLNQLSPVVKTIKRSNSNTSLEQSSKKAKLFDDDDDDMPEWCPPELQNKMPPQSTTASFQALPPCPPRPPPPPIPPPPRVDSRPLFSYQPFRPAISSPPPTFIGGPPSLPLPLPPPPPPPPLPSNQALWHRPGSSNVNPTFPSLVGRRPQL